MRRCTEGVSLLLLAQETLCIVLHQEPAPGTLASLDSVTALEQVSNRCIALAGSGSLPRMHGFAHSDSLIP